MSADDDRGGGLIGRVPGMRSDAPKRNVIVGLLTLLLFLLFGGFVREALALPLLFRTGGRIRR